MLVIFSILVLIFIVSAVLLSWRDSEAGGFTAVASFIAAVVLLFGSIGSYLFHASNLGIIRGQQAVVKVYQERIDRLEERLDSFNYPKGSSISLNADSPVASIVNSLSEAEMGLAKAKETQANAVVSIEQRKAGPYSFIVDWIGEK